MDDFFDDYGEPDFWAWGIIGGLSEELAREKRDIDRARYNLTPGLKPGK